MAKESASVRRELVRDDEVFDVPAAVLCACCGQPDCAGCAAASDGSSGVVAIIPWERPVGSVWSRLWATSKATTLGAETFFAMMPDGALPSAMRFALLAETLAILAMIVALLPVAALALPSLTLELARNPAARDSALQCLAVGVPGLTVWMVLAHTVHGAALDLGARRQGARPERRRALRFGLYACGWDLMAGPLGALVMLVTSGVQGAGQVLSASLRVPGKASTALLQGVYALRPEAAERARRAGSVAALALTVASGLAAVALVLAVS
ncbi:hypothetical protein SOCEGT47_015620 [Sorangium cellulosum]|uniref:Uncharacterized protein n=1 Tax=Sorangium cellulosum TaxID=56 RepID=A0A4P2PWD2_SORCE|nr:hypothetical protein [Sorangium cellulosum]AUX21084.1 hypothetical protein SOCEGT47_015620 [Sorangium cellulosum]